MAHNRSKKLYFGATKFGLALRHRGQPVVNIVGVFRSGTNLLKATLEANFKTRVVFNDWYWKHGLPPTRPSRGFYIAPPVPIIVISKDPVQLNVSLHRFWEKTRPELGTGQSLSEFIRSEFVVYDNSFEPHGPEYFYETPTHYWNAFYRTYLNWPSQKDQIYFLRYQDLIQKPDTVLGELGEKIGLKRRTNCAITLPELQVLPSSDKAKSALGAKMHSPSVLDAISEADANFILGQARPAVLTGLGYAVKTRAS